jgi:(S)-2-hydroxyglutarate dehydrogenase
MRALYDYCVVGGGIVGLSTAWHLTVQSPRARVIVLEKEPAWGVHQTGRNSGVIHSGVYYRPGSFKAKFARAGSRSLVAFCRAHDIPHAVCGKLIVARAESELPRLAWLHERGRENGIEVEWVTAEAVVDLEPHVNARAAIRVPTAGIVDFRAVAFKFVELLYAHGAELRLGAEVMAIRSGTDAFDVELRDGAVQARHLINCAGLQADRVARLAGADPEITIVPFRGEYYDLVPERRHLVRNLVYPVPHLDFPFLGVHLTRTIAGIVHAGPNAVLALGREGYRGRDIDARDLWQTVSAVGFWRFARRHWAEGAREIARSCSKRLFVRSLQTMVPEIRAGDLVSGASGVRAQAIARDGSLSDDFVIIRRPRAVHVCSAPSPAATCCLEIGRSVAAWAAGEEALAS